MNIFEVIRRTTGRTEPFHTRFLAEALRESASGDRALFDAFWAMAVPDGVCWPPPKKPVILEEQQLAEGRIDVVILDVAGHRVIGVEGKTVESSVQEGQLASYFAALRQKYDGDEVQLVFLTPFNRHHAGVSADSLDSVRTFDIFRQLNPSAVHLSWLDVSRISWSGGELWTQHCEFVETQMCSQELLVRHARAQGNPGLVDAYIAAVESDPNAHPIQSCQQMASALASFSSVEALYKYTVCVFNKDGSPLKNDEPVSSAYWLLFDNVYSRRRPGDKFPTNATDVPGFRPKGGHTDEQVAARLWDCAVAKCGPPFLLRPPFGE